LENKHLKNKKMEGYKYYLENLNGNKAICYMFGKLPIPSGIPFTFTLSTIIVASLLEITFPTLFIVPILSLILCFEHYTIIYLRANILEECMTEERCFQMGLIEDGINPEFEHDSLHVTDSDRGFILSDRIYFSKKKKRLGYKIKNHYQFLISIVILFIVVYSFFRVLYSF
jgi:hypothetical protein